VFGSSGGAVVGLALVTAHPDQVRTLVAHEPPVVELQPDRMQVCAQFDDIYDTYRAEGADKAMPKFIAHAGLGGAADPEAGTPRWQPSPEQAARIQQGLPGTRQRQVQGMDARSDLEITPLLTQLPTALVHADREARVSCKQGAWHFQVMSCRRRW
jgi:pimeloyl-ACP methyl ester carboxylesterase